MKHATVPDGPSAAGLPAFSLGFEAGHSCLFHFALEAVTSGVYVVDLQRRIRYWNSASARLAGFSAQDVVGKSCGDNLLNHVDAAGNRLCLTACPLTACMADGKAQVASLYLHHKMGYRVPVQVRGVALRDAGGAIVGAVEVFEGNRRHHLAERRMHHLEKLALSDPLTGLANRRRLEELLTACMRGAKRHNTSFGVLLLDIDEFKRVNDMYGHGIGDAILVSTARTLENAVRAADLVGRWGGEEFLVVLPNADLKLLDKVAGRCRTLVQQAFVTAGSESVSVTISGGGAVFAPGSDSLAAVLQRADRLLYASKQSGRNRMTVE